VKGQKISKKQNRKICKGGRIYNYNLNSAAPKSNKYFFGRKHTEEAKRKMKIKRKEQKPPMLGKKHSEKTKRKIRKSRIKYMASGNLKKKQTKIEQTIETELKRRNIYYEKQIPLCKISIVDFYLPETRTVIYCDGNYWHSLEKVKQRDINQNFILMFHGFNVYRFTETEINKSPKRCINKILRTKS
jgi:very-short-patch-repair endonuclease